MPFGLHNAPATFRHLIVFSLREFIGKFVVVYIDDILVYSPDAALHVEHIRAVFARLYQHSLACKHSKYVFAVDTVKFCGHVVSPGVICPVEGKLDRIAEWLLPKSVRDV